MWQYLETFWLSQLGVVVMVLLLLLSLLQSCPTLCDPRDGSPPGSPVPGILQARTLEWVAISFSNAWKWKVKVKSLTHVWLLATPWTAAYQAPPSMGFFQARALTGMGCHRLLWGVVLLVSNGWRPGTLLNILQHTGWPPPTPTRKKLFCLKRQWNGVEAEKPGVVKY